MRSSPSPVGLLYHLFISLTWILLGLFCFYHLANTTKQWWNARAWQPVEAQLESKVYTTNMQHDGKAYARHGFWYYYHYAVGGVEYIGSDLTFGYFMIASEWDEARVISRLKGAKVVTVWVDPQQPEHAILDRSFRCQPALWWLVCGLTAFGFALWNWRMRWKDYLDG